MLKKMTTTTLMTVIFSSFVLQAANLTDEVLLGGNETRGVTDMLSCYHVVDGVRRHTPYTLVPVGTSCPSCGSNANCMADDLQEEERRNKSTPLIPPHLCDEEAVKDWF